MTKDEFLAALRQALQIIAGALITGGYITSGKAEVLIGVILAAASFAWMLFTKRRERTEVEAKVKEALYTPVPDK